MGMVVRLVILASAVALAAGVAPARASVVAPARGTVHLSAQPNAAGYLILVSGTYTQFPSDVDVYVHAGSAPCAAKALAENTRIEHQVQSGENAASALITQELGTGLRTSGSFSLQAYWGLNAHSGVYMACAYLLGPQASAHGSPADPPQARASLRLTMGAVSTTSSGPPFTLLDVRVQLSGNSDSSLSRPAIHTVRGGQLFYLQYTVHVNRALTIRVATWTFTIEHNGRALTTHSWNNPSRQESPIRFPAGIRFAITSGGIHLSPKSASYLATFVGKVTIDGITRRKSTWVRIVR